MDGIYSMTFRGAADWGMGMLMLRKGVATGADVAGLLYDGTYIEQGSFVKCQLTMNVPAGVQLVQGAPAQSKPYSIDAELTIPRSAFEKQETVLLQLPHGPVNVIFQKLRRIED